VSSSHFFAYLYRLRFIQRWILMRSAVPENVAEHTFQVALLTHALCTIARDVFGKSGVDAGAAVIVALFHDAEEVMTGDIPSPVKHHNPGMLRSIREIEALASQQLLDMVPTQLADSYRDIIGDGQRRDDLLRWVKAADTLDDSSWLAERRSCPDCRLRVACQDCRTVRVVGKAYRHGRVLIAVEALDQVERTALNPTQRRVVVTGDGGAAELTAWIDGTGGSAVISVGADVLAATRIGDPDDGQPMPFDVRVQAQGEQAVRGAWTIRQAGS